MDLKCMIAATVAIGALWTGSCAAAPGYACNVRHVVAKEGGADVYFQQNKGQPAIYVEETTYPGVAFRLTYNYATPLDVRRGYFLADDQKAYFSGDIHSGCTYEIATVGETRYLKISWGEHIPGSPGFETSTLVSLSPYPLGNPPDE